jgi:uncharacterized protein (TIGR03067 family)
MTAFTFPLVALCVACADLGRLEGNWDCVRMSVAGKVAPAARWKGVQLKITGRDWTFASMPMRAVAIDPSRSPKRIEFQDHPSAVTPSDVTGRYAWVYLIEGDKLKVSHYVRDFDYPARVDGSGERQICLEFKRANKK